jgi:hypothetical protein
MMLLLLRRWMIRGLHDIIIVGRPNGESEYARASEKGGDENRRRRLMMRRFDDCGTGRHDHHCRRWSSRRRGGIENEREEREERRGEREAMGESLVTGGRSRRYPDSFRSCTPNHPLSIIHSSIDHRTYLALSGRQEHQQDEAWEDEFHGRDWSILGNDLFLFLFRMEREIVSHAIC